MNIINALAVLGAKYLFVVIIGISFVWFLKLSKDRKKEVLVYGTMAVSIMYALLKIAALLYYDPRPFVVGHFVPLIPHVPDNGFPSDHTIVSSAAAAVVYPYNKNLAMVLWALTLLVGASRVYTGIHHVTDIAASIIIAVFAAFLTYTYALPRVMKTKKYKNSWQD